MMASLSLRRLFVTVAVVLAVACLLQLLYARSTDSLLGLWDSGRLSREVMPEPVQVPEDQLSRLLGDRRIQLQADPRKGSNLTEIFQWYGLDQRYLDATVQMDHLDPTRIPPDPFDVVLAVPSSSASSSSSGRY